MGQLSPSAARQARNQLWLLRVSNLLPVAPQSPSVQVHEASSWTTMVPSHPWDR